MKSGEQQFTSNSEASKDDNLNEIFSQAIDRRRFLQYAAGAGAVMSLGGSALGHAQQNAAAVTDTHLPDGT